MSLIPAIRRAVQAVEPDLALINIKTQAEELNEKYLGGVRSVTPPLEFFSALALSLAAIGLYGTMSYAVGRRTQEIGIRMALGAGRKDLFALVLGETLWLVALGVALGLPLALAANCLIASPLFGVKTTDAVTLSSAISVTLLMALLAGYIPAHRATRVDPLVALRCE